MYQITEIPLKKLEPSKLNVRKDLHAGQEDSDLASLAASIREQGLLSPIIVRGKSDGTYEVVAGQRRLRACQTIDLNSVPCIVRNDLSDSDAEILSLVENVQRADMSPLDKAHALKKLYGQRGTYESVAKVTGWSIATVRRYVLLLNLPEKLQKKLTTADGPRQIVAMSRIAENFKSDDAEAVYDQIAPFQGRIQNEIIKQSGGDIEKLPEIIERAKAGAFGDRTCGGKYGCLVIGDILSHDLTVDEFESMIEQVAGNLDNETKRQTILVAARGFWNSLARETY